MRYFFENIWIIDHQHSRSAEVFPELCTPDLAPLPNAPIPTPKPKPILKPTTPSDQQQPESQSNLHRRAAPSSSTQSASTANPHRAARANEAGAVVENVWQNVRSNMWRILLLVVFLYLVVLKVVDRVADESIEA